MKGESICLLLAPKEDPESKEEYFQIQSKGPVFNVGYIAFNPFPDIIAIFNFPTITINLCQSCYPWFYGMAQHKAFHHSPIHIGML